MSFSGKANQDLEQENGNRQTSTKSARSSSVEVDVASASAEESYSKLKTKEDASEHIQDDHLPLWRKFCFAVGGAPYQITSTVIGFFLTVFLLEVAQLQPRYVSIILFSGKAWDAITDPTIGILVLKTNTRWGKMRPWILFSAPFACVAYFFLFYIPWSIIKDSSGKEIVDATDFEKFAFYFGMFCLFEGFLSCLHVPYTAMTMYVAIHQKDRDSITAIRMVCEAVGVLAAVFIQGSFVSSSRCTGDKGSQQKSSIDIMAQRDAYMRGSFIVVGLYIMCCLVVFFGSKERKGPIENVEHYSFLKSFKLVFKFKPFIWASLVFLFMYMSIAISQGNIALYCTHVLNMGDQFTYFIGVLLIVTILAMPAWYFITLKIGKKTSYALGIIILLPGFFAQLFIPEGTAWIYYMFLVISGFGMSATFLLPWSLLPDVLDLYMLENNVRHDSLFYSFYVFFNKFSAGIALAISQLALEFGGYVSGQCYQPPEVSDTLRYLMAPGPVVVLLIALLCLYKYPINESRRRDIKQRIMELTVDYKERVAVETTSNSYDSIGNMASRGAIDTHM